MNFENVIQKTIFVTIVVFLWSCDEKDMVPQSNSDYFPLENQTEWRYERWHSEDKTPVFILDTLYLRVGSDITIDGKTYKQILNQFGEADKIIRTKGSMYFGRNHELYGGYSHEYMFLDAEKPAGYSWSYIKDNGASKTTYMIKAKNTEHTIRGTVYSDVIEVEVNYYEAGTNDEFDYRFSVIHYYAKGVGEIYNFYPGQAAALGNVSSYIL